MRFAPESFGAWATQAAASRLLESQYPQLGGTCERRLANRPLLVPRAARRTAARFPELFAVSPVTPHKLAPTSRTTPDALEVFIGRCRRGSSFLHALVGEWNKAPCRQGRKKSHRGARQDQKPS